jgi:hypothetical protein
MSLDVYLESDTTRTEPERLAIFIRENGQTTEVSREEWDRRNPGREPVMAKVGGKTRTLYHANITHNLGAMADAAGIYGHLWRPEESGVLYARHLIEPLAAGYVCLLTDPVRYKEHNPDNGWGTYEGLLAFVAGYLTACIANPNAIVSASR